MENKPPSERTKLQLKEAVGRPYEAKETFRKKVRPLLKKEDDLQRLLRLTLNSERFLSKVWQSLEGNEEIRNQIRAVSQLEGDERDKAISTALSYLKKEHGYFFNLFDHIDFSRPGGGEEKAEQVRKQVEENVCLIISRYVDHRAGLPAVTIDQENEVVAGIAGVLVNYSNDFSTLKDGRDEQLAIDLSRRLEGSGTEKRKLDCQIIVEEEFKRVEAALQVYFADPEMAKQRLHSWIREHYHHSLVGKKIFESPYYRDLIEYCLRLGDKENGIGGKIYFGPPGTGKTEMAKEVNKQEGYESRVVSVHYWTSFSQLFGEAMLQVKGQGLGSQAETLNQAAGFFDELRQKGTTGAVAFWRIVQRAAEKSGQEPVEFLNRLSLKDEEGSLILESEGEEEGFRVSLEQKQALLDSYYLQLGERILSITEGGISLEDEAEAAGWVKGEILLAIENGQRVILDEVDKAGPGSIDSLSHLLAISPGSEFTIRDLDIQLPNWFRIDATANVLELGGEKQYFYDRFNRVFVDYPPAKDEMMLASVWLSDREGHINISEYRQYQLSAFFTILLPRIRRMYREDRLAQPVSIRAVKELCNLVVPPRTGRDSGISIEVAIKQLLLKQRAMAADGQQLAELEDLISRFRPIFTPELQADDFRAKPIPEKAELGLREERIRTIKDRLEAISISPLLNSVITTANDSYIEPEEHQEIRGLKFSLVELVDPAVRQRLDKVLEQEPPSSGLQYAVFPKDGEESKYKGQLIAHLETEEPGQDQVILLEFDAGEFAESEVDELLGQSKDGNVLLISLLPKNEGNSDKKFAFHLELNGIQEPLRSRRIVYQENKQIRLFPDGSGITLFDPEQGDLVIIYFQKDQELKSSKFGFACKRVAIGKNGRVLLVETGDGRTILYDFQELEERMPSKIEERDAAKIYNTTGLDFIGERLIGKDDTSVVALIGR